MSEFLYAASVATLEIIWLLHCKHNELYISHNIGAGGDYSLGADLCVEAIFARHLLPLANIDSEESGLMQGCGDDVIVLDPLDGSDNFLSHIPYYGASLALCDKQGQVKEAFVCNFCTKEVKAKIGQNPPFTYTLPHYHFNIDTNAPLKCVMQDLEHFTNSAQHTKTLENLRDKINKSHNTLTSTKATKCGIFEKAYTHPQISLLLYENKLKFRSLGASALSIALSFEVNFMLFCGNIRHFDSKAGLFLTQDLYQFQNNNILLVSKDKRFFDMIYKMLVSRT